MAQEANANEQKKFKVPRIPGDIMIYPMIVGLLLNTFCPQVFEIGGFFTAACRGGSNTIVAAILLFVGAGISFKSTPGAIKTGIVVLIPKLVVAAALGLGVAYFFNDNLLGLSSVSIIGGITFCNMALYTGIMGEFGDESEQGAVGILFFTAGPAVTMIILGVSGLATSLSVPSSAPFCRSLSAWFWAISSRSSRTCWFPAPIPRSRHRISARCVHEPVELYHRRYFGHLAGPCHAVCRRPYHLCVRALCGGNGKAAVACSTMLARP